MRHLLAIITLCTLWAAAPITGRAEAFLPGFEDIPLMEGLISDTDEGMVFDTPEGRIAEASAKGNVSRKKVLEFYAATLPQLGWLPDGKGGFKREQETLTLEISNSKTSQRIVRFQIKPLGATRK